MLLSFSPHEIAMTKAAQRRAWDAFKARGTSHSASASTLPYLLRRCEQEKVPYVLKAMPGQGYWLEPGA